MRRPSPSPSGQRRFREIGLRWYRPSSDPVAGRATIRIDCKQCADETRHELKGDCSHGRASLDDRYLAGFVAYRRLYDVEVDAEGDVQVLLGLEIPGHRTILNIPRVVQRDHVVAARREDLDGRSRRKMRELDLPFTAPARDTRIQRRLECRCGDIRVRHHLHHIERVLGGCGIHLGQLRLEIEHVSIPERFGRLDDVLITALEIVHRIRLVARLHRGEEHIPRREEIAARTLFHQNDIVQQSQLLGRPEGYPFLEQEFHIRTVGVAVDPEARRQSAYHTERARRMDVSTMVFGKLDFVVRGLLVPVQRRIQKRKVRRSEVHRVSARAYPTRGRIVYRIHIPDIVEHHGHAVEDIRLSVFRHIHRALDIRTLKHRIVQVFHCVFARRE